MSLLPLSILADFATVADGLSPIILHYQPDKPLGSPPQTPYPPMQYLHVEHSLRRERTLMLDMGIPADTVTFHLWNPELEGIEPHGNTELIDNQGFVYVVQAGAIQTFSSRLRVECRIPDAGNYRYHPWSTFPEFLANLTDHPPYRLDDEWRPGQ